MAFTKEQLDKILEEVSAFQIELEPDPTLPHLGGTYLRELVSKCRNYSNRVQHYMRQVAIQTRELSRELKIKQLDLEMKTQELLAEDERVRRQSNIKDREAMAAGLLKQEHLERDALQVAISDLMEVQKILRSSHRELAGTNQDIKSMRQMVKDDRDGDGYTAPHRNQDRTVPGGLPGVVRAHKIDPKDLLDPETRPADIAAPVDEAHARMMTDFLNDAPADAVPAQAEEDAPIKSINYDDLLVD